MKSARFFVFASLSLFLAACGGSGGPGGPGGVVPIVQLTVTTLEDDGPGSLRQVVTDAPPGAEITFDPAIAGGTVDVLSPISLSKPVTITGGPPGGETTLDGGDGTRIFNVIGTQSVGLYFLDLSNGHSAGDGGAILIQDATVFMAGVTFTSCYAATWGGAIAAYDSHVEISQCHFVSNTADQGGAMRLEGGPTRIQHTSVVFNTATAGYGGGIVYDGGEHVIRSSTVHGNTAVAGPAGLRNGGGIAAYGQFFSSALDLEIYGCTITGNSAGDLAGGLHVAANLVSGLLCRQTIIAENTAPSETDVEIEGTVTTESAYNVIGIESGGPIWNGLDDNQVGDGFSPLDPDLGALLLVGATLSREPNALSPAVGVVPHADCVNENGEPLTHDQRFMNRLGDAAADVGAVEYVP